MNLPFEMSNPATNAANRLARRNELVVPRRVHQEEHPEPVDAVSHRESTCVSSADSRAVRSRWYTRPARVESMPSASPVAGGGGAANDVGEVHRHGANPRGVNRCRSVGTRSRGASSCASAATSRSVPARRQRSRPAHRASPALRRVAPARSRRRGSKLSGPGTILVTSPLGCGKHPAM